MIDLHDDPSCRACRFWQSDAGELGDCRRHAPRPAMDGQLVKPAPPEGEFDTAVEAVWPLTMAGDFCGDFRPRPGNFRPSWGGQ